MSKLFPSVATFSKTFFKEFTSLSNHALFASWGVRDFSLVGFQPGSPILPRSGPSWQTSQALRSIFSVKSDAASAVCGIGNGGTGGGGHEGMRLTSSIGGGPSGIRVPLGVHCNLSSFFTRPSPASLTGLA